MFLNDVEAFFKQQSGHQLWQHSNALFKRLICIRENSYTHLYPPTGREILECRKDTPIFSCKFSPQQGNEHILALANEDGKLVIHNSDNHLRFGSRAHNNAIFDLSWMYNKPQLISASGDQTAQLLDVGDCRVRTLNTFHGHNRSVKSVTVKYGSDDIFATGGRDGKIYVWDCRASVSSVCKADEVIFNSHLSSATPKKSKKKKVDKCPNIRSVTGLAFQDENTLVSCGADDNTLKIWDIRKTYTNYKNQSIPKAIIPYPGNSMKQGYSSLILDGAAGRLYASCLDSTIYCYNIGASITVPVMSYTGHQNSTFYVKSYLSKDGSHLLSGSSDGNAYIWHTKRPKPIVRLVGHTAEVTCVAWCDERAILVTCSDDLTHKFWTINREEQPENWQMYGIGMAEELPGYNEKNEKQHTKKVSFDELECTPKKIIKLSCECGTTELCKSCNKVPKQNNSHLTNSTNEIEPNEFGPKKLFDFSDVGQADEKMDGVEEYALSSKLPKLENAFEEIRISNPHCSRDTEETIVHNSEEHCPTQNKDSLISSFISDLPNFVEDGVAPHLYHSPPKRRSQDWLTSLRNDKMLIKKNLDKTDSGCIPKQGRADMKSRRNTTPKNSISKYFKVSSSYQCDESRTKVHSNN